ncbi:MAG: hypothetical protein JSW23_07285 [Planctomycetota bacterium]|nr:MAG: hypothetical protein JSW23_07285 [Planctomycetota bacterium]
MEAEMSHKAEKRKRPKTKIAAWVLACVVVLLLLLTFFVPWLVSSEAGRKMILAKVNDSVDGEVDFGGLSMGWFTGIRVTDISFKDSTGSISAAVKQVATKPHYGSIVMGRLSFGETVIDEPRVEVDIGGLEPKERGVSGEGERAAVGLPISRVDLVVNDGGLKVFDKEVETVGLSRINSKVNLRRPGRRSTFDIDMAVVSGGEEANVAARGGVRPGYNKKGWTLEGTSGDLAIEVNDLEVGSLGPILALLEVEVEGKGRISADINGEIKEGRLESLRAEVKGKDLDVRAAGLMEGRFKTGRLDINAELLRQKQMINIENLDVQADWFDGRAKGTVPTTFGSLSEFLKSESKLSGNFELDVAQLSQQMPGILRLKEDARVTSGKLTGSIETLTEEGERKIKGQAELAGLGGTVRSKAVALTEPVTARLQIAPDEDGVKFDRLDLSSSFAKINCSGSSQLLKWRGGADLARLQSELGQFADMKGYKVAGEVSGEGEVAMGEDKVIANGSSEIKGLRLISAEGLSASEPMAEVTFSVSSEQAREIVDIDFVEARGSFGRLGVKNASLPLAKETARPMKAPVSAKVDLAKVQMFAVVLGALPKEMQLAGTAESEITISSEKNIYRVATDATKIDNLKVVYPGKEPFEQEQVSVVFDAEVSPVEKSVNVRRFELISPQIKIKKGEFSRVTKEGRTKLAGQVDCEYDWAAVSTVASAFLPKGLKMEGKRKDTVTFSSEYPADSAEQMLANLDTGGKLGFERAEYMGLRFGPTEVDVQVRKGLLKIAPFSAAVNKGEVSFAGEADFKQKPTLLKTPGPIQVVKEVQINDETTKRLLMYLNPVFADAVNVSGVANLECERLAIPLAGATKNDIEIVGTVSIEELLLQASPLLDMVLSVVGTRAGGQVITIRPTKFTVRDGLVKYDDMQMDVGNNPVNFKGVIGLDKSLNMTVTLPYTYEGRTVRVGQADAGDRVSVPLKGTLNKPELDLGRLLQEQLLERGLRELLK